MAVNGGRIIGIVHEAKYLFANVATSAAGPQSSVLLKLYGKGRLINVVMNDQNVFTVNEPHFPLCMAAHLPDILEAMRSPDSLGLFTRFEFAYVKPNFQHLVLSCAGFVYAKPPPPIRFI